MSLYRLFQGVVGRLKRRRWGVRIEQEDKPPLDSGVEAFAQEMYQALSSDAPIELSGPIRFTRRFSGPAFEVTGSEAAIGYVAPDGTTSGANVATIRVRIVSVLDDSLIVEGSDAGRFQIAKPYELRRSSTDKKTINSITYVFTGPQTRSASGTIEQVTPPYAFGDELIAVLVENGFEVISPEGTPFLYVDSNAGGKRWHTEDSPSNPADNTRWRIASVADYEQKVATLPVTGATNATPIVLTVVNHGLASGMRVTIREIEGNTAGNGSWEVDAKTCRLINATNASPIVATTDKHHGYLDGTKITILGVRGMTSANNTAAQPSWFAKYVNDLNFSLWEDSGLTVPVVGNADFDGDSRPICSLADTFSIYQLAPQTKNITGATNATPIVVTCVGHGYLDNSFVIVLGVLGNTAANNTSANDTWQINFVDADHFELIDSVGNGPYTSGGTVTPAFENFLDGVAGNGTYTANTGTMIIPGRITITAATHAQAQAVGFRVGLGLRMRSDEGGTTYGVITALPGTEGYPFHRPAPTRLPNAAHALSFAGHPLLGNLTELAVGDPAQVIQQTMICNFLPHYGSKNQLPISQLVQGTPTTLVDKWRGFGGGNVLGVYGRALSHWYGPSAQCVAFSAAHHNAPNVDDAPQGAFSGGTVTIIPDRARPFNANGLHTDGSTAYGSLVTKSSSLPLGHAVTGLKGWLFQKTQTGAGPPTLEVLETTAVADGGIGTDLQTAITSSTDATPIVVTVVDHGLSDGLKIQIVGHLTNVAANGFRYVDKLTDDTFALYSDSTLTTAVAGSGAGSGSGGYFTHGLLATQCVLESLTMEAAAGSLHWIEDFAQGPFINVDIGGQLLSHANGQRGIRTFLFDNVLVYNVPTAINKLSSDVIYNSRQEIAVLGLGNRPGGVLDSGTQSGASAYLTVFLVFVVE